MAVELRTAPAVHVPERRLLHTTKTFPCESATAFVGNKHWQSCMKCLCCCYLHMCASGSNKK
jgi:hypothetical protein